MQMLQDKLLERMLPFKCEAESVQSRDSNPDRRRKTRERLVKTWEDHRVKEGEKKLKQNTSRK